MIMNPGRPGWQGWHGSLGAAAPEIALLIYGQEIVLCWHGPRREWLSGGAFWLRAVAAKLGKIHRSGSFK